MKICIYCSSSSKVHQKYFDATAKLGQLLAENQYDLIYGGGRHGLMGCLADTMLMHGGTVHGIIPHFMKEVEWAHDQLSSLQLTDTLHERKAGFLNNADAIVALPGGCGTLEELMEVITLKRLGMFTKPIVILNTEGYYDPLRQMLERCVEENFMDYRHLMMWSWVKEPEEVIPAILGAPDWDSGAISFALQK